MIMLSKRPGFEYLTALIDSGQMACECTGILITLIRTNLFAIQGAFNIFIWVDYDYNRMHYHFQKGPVILKCTK